MGLPVNFEIDSRYVMTNVVNGNTSKISITRISDGQEKSLVMREAWINIFDFACNHIIGDHAVMGRLCDELFE